MKYISLWLFAIMITLAPVIGFADDPAPVVEATTAVAEVAAVEVPVSTIISQLMKVATDWKAFGWQAGLIALITLLLSTLKNSFLRTYLWDKLGPCKVFAAPILSMLAIFIGMGEFSWAGALVGITTGGGAIALHQMLDGVKKMPGVGSVALSMADLLGKLLKAPPKKG